MNKLGPRVKLYIIQSDDMDAIDKTIGESWYAYMRSYLVEYAVVKYVDMNQRIMNAVQESTSEHS